jgi:transcriptional regulator with XRE-family HTH domain
LAILKRLRAEAGKTLKQVAEDTGIDPATISQLENGRRKARYNTLYTLVKYYGRDIDEEEFKTLLDDGSERGRAGGLASQRKKEKRAA